LRVLIEIEGGQSGGQRLFEGRAASGFHRLVKRFASELVR